MPVGIKVNRDDPVTTIKPEELKEGEMYRDDGGDWALVISQDDKEGAICAVFDPDDSRNPRWFRFTYTHGSNFAFTGPYEATVHIGPLKSTAK